MRIVDTTVWIDAERLRSPAVDRLSGLVREGAAAVSTVTVYELTCGPSTPASRLDYYAELFATSVQVLPLGVEEVEAAARLARLVGRSLGAPDALIAGTALANGMPLVTCDGGFRGLPGLTVELVPRTPVVHEPVAPCAAPAVPATPGARLRALRAAAGLRAHEAAQAAGMAPSNWARLESGRHAPALATLARAARALRVPISALLG
ncbi:MAG: type II toxin-antitoxin system VapC family toxin [Deltaproteobacteria bacterium]|nr:type II toxin-antitoxin system VapC family toxin [Deltaproteobacteria bacterium]